MKGEPKIAPVAIPCALLISAFEKYIPKIATMGTIVSGKPVPMTAKIEPVALLPNFSLFPRNSIALVNKIQEKTIAISDNTDIVK